MSDSKIEVVAAFCPDCGSVTFNKEGNIHDALGKIQKFTRAICKKGCGYVGSTILVSTGQPVIPFVPEKEKQKRS